MLLDLLSSVGCISKNKKSFYVQKITKKPCCVLPLPSREKAKTVKNNKMAFQNTNSHLCYWMQF